MSRFKSHTEPDGHWSAPSTPQWSNLQTVGTFTLSSECLRTAAYRIVVKKSVNIASSDIFAIALEKEDNYKADK